MNQMVLMVVDNPDYCTTVLEAWADAGASGITILESTGLMKVRQAGIHRDDIPLLPSLRDLLRGTEERHRTIFSVVDDEATVESVIAATERVFAEMQVENSGVLFVLPVSGVHRFATRATEAKRATH